MKVKSENEVAQAALKASRCVQQLGSPLNSVVGGKAFMEVSIF